MLQCTHRSLLVSDFLRWKRDLAVRELMVTGKTLTFVGEGKRKKVKWHEGKGKKRESLVLE